MSYYFSCEVSPVSQLTRELHISFFVNCFLSLRESPFAHSYLRKPLLLYIFDIIQHRPFLHDDWKYYERIGYLRLCFVVYLKKHYGLAIQMSPVYYETLPSGQGKLRPFIEQNMRIFIEKINNTEIFYNNPIDYNEITEELNKTVYERTGCK